MKWAHGNRLFAGQKDGSLVAYLDVLRSTHSARYISLHGQEICGIDLHYNSNLLATGANDNCVKLFDMRNSRSLYTLRHNAAVKGLCFDKHRSNKLYTGAGSKDQKIRAWNVSTGELCFSQETGSQICDLIQLCSSRTLVTSHGYASNDIKIWKIDRDCIHLSEVLAGHSERVLKMSLSHDETMIASVAGDEF
ncbi:WD40 repeat-like protein, partial [Rozella allomycis CSF55]